MKRAYTHPISSVNFQDYELLAKLAWEEDCPEEDITSVSLFSIDQNATANLNSREPGILCGTGVLEVLNALSGNKIRSELFKKDSESFQAGETLFKDRRKSRSNSKDRKDFTKFYSVSFWNFDYHWRSS